jgi:signal peptidase
MNPPKNAGIVGKVQYFIERFKTSDNFFVGWIKDLMFIAGMILLIMLVSQITLGLPMPAVAVESKSMMPNIHIGDVVIIQSYDRTDIITCDEGVKLDYESFNGCGDVILYYKYGDTTATPVIHRAMYRVNEGEPMWTNGPPAPYAGYITKGDNNDRIDQATDISRFKPIKDEWIIGVSRWKIPWIGYVSLIRSKLF